MRLRKLEGLPNILKLKEEGIILGWIAGALMSFGIGFILNPKTKFVLKYCFLIYRL
jgi:hypothetical protein